MRMIIMVLVVLGLFGCSGPTGPTAMKTWSPEDLGWPYPAAIKWEHWEQRHPHLQADIDHAGMAADCETLYNLFGEAIDVPEGNEEVLTYIQRWGQHANCERFLDTQPDVE
jgi:hypothetical protein